jgi:hypothetical protein
VIAVGKANKIGIMQDEIRNHSRRIRQRRIRLGAPFLHRLQNYLVDMLFPNRGASPEPGWRAHTLEIDQWTVAEIGIIANICKASSTRRGIKSTFMEAGCVGALPPGEIFIDPPVPDD